MSYIRGIFWDGDLPNGRCFMGTPGPSPSNLAKLQLTLLFLSNVWSLSAASVAVASQDLPVFFCRGDAAVPVTSLLYALNQILLQFSEQQRPRLFANGKDLLNFEWSSFL